MQSSMGYSAASGSRSFGFILVASIVAFMLAGCGGGNGNNSEAPVPTKVVVSPSTVSLNSGDVVQLSAQVVDQNGNPMFRGAIEFASKDPQVAEISTGGLLCGGTWDDNFIVCTPGATGNTAITATGVEDNLTSDPVPVFVHAKVDKVVVEPALVDCSSVSEKATFTARAFSGGTDITSTVGGFTWSSADVTVASITAADDRLSAEAKALKPGKTSIIASVSGTTGLPGTLVVCPPVEIAIHVKDKTDTAVTLSLTNSESSQLAADVTDSKGNTITDLTLNWISQVPGAAPVTSSGNVTSRAPGGSGVLASCSPPNCNTNVNEPIYSNLVSVTVTGTAKAQKVYVTSSQAPSGDAKPKLVPINTSDDSVGTAVELASVPNSLLFEPNGVTAYLGSSEGVLRVQGSDNAAQARLDGAPGKVLAVSIGGAALVLDDSTGKARIVEEGAVTSTFDAPGGTAAAFSPDGFKVFVAAGSTLVVHSRTQSPRIIALAAPAGDAAFLASGPFGYLAGGSASAANAFATCDNSLAGGVALPATPQLVATVPASDTILAVDSDSIHAIAATVVPADCPPGVSHALTSATFGQSFTPHQILVSSDGKRAYILSDLPEVLVYDLESDTTSSIALAGGATPSTGGLTLDGGKIYVGASDGKVHVLDTTAATDTKQIDAGVTPDLVAVRPVPNTT